MGIHWHALDKRSGTVNGCGGVTIVFGGVFAGYSTSFVRSSWVGPRELQEFWTQRRIQARESLNNEEDNAKEGTD